MNYSTDLSAVRTIKGTRGKRNVHESRKTVSPPNLSRLSCVEGFLTTLFRRANINDLRRIYDYVEKRALCVRLFETAAPGNWLLSFVEAAYYSFRQRGSRNSLNGTERVRA